MKQEIRDLKELYDLILDTLEDKENIERLYEKLHELEIEYDLDRIN